MTQKRDPILSGQFGQMLENIGVRVENPGKSEVPAVSKDKVLDLRNKDLEKVPTYVFDMNSLEELDLSNNSLVGAIPAEIRHLKNLKVLRASNNMMTGVPAEIGQLSNLEELDLSNNQLTGLPNELGNLKNLKVFNLYGNNYSAQDLKYIQDRLPETKFILN